VASPHVLSNNPPQVLSELASLKTDVGHLAKNIEDMRSEVRESRTEVASVRERISETAGVRRWMLVIVGAVLPLALAGLVNAIQMQASIDELRRAMTEHTSGGGHRETHAAIESLRAQMFQWTTQQLSHESEQDQAIRALGDRVGDVEYDGKGRKR